MSGQNQQPYLPSLLHNPQQTAQPATTASNQTPPMYSQHPYYGPQPSQPAYYYSPMSTMPGQQAAAMPPALPIGQQGQPIAPAGQGGDYRPLNVRDALSYLDQVKLQFAHQPQVYNQFLDIMKDFKSQAIDTPGVIERVSNLFRGHPSLIVGFNTFLPPGYRIDINHDQSTYTITTPESTLHYAVHPPAQPNTIPPQQPAPNFNAQNTQAGSYKPVTVPGPQPAPPTVPPAAIEKKPIEFNHAINYVNKIKNRYSNDPETYKQFLEILRTYQNDAKPIHEVYAQVQSLFHNAPDLLDEFKQFLPDHSIGSNSNGSQSQFGNESLPKGSIMAGPPPQAFKPKPKRTSIQSVPFKKQQSRFIDPRQIGRNYSFTTNEEFDFFEKVKKALANKTSYIEFLKILNLFNQNIVDVKQLVEKVEPFLARTPELFEWFKAYVRFDDDVYNAQHLQQQQQQQMPPKDLTDAKRSGSSYRLLPSDYHQSPCSGRDALCLEVLNDNWVCHPTWASEDGGFIAHRKNQFEEALYRTEEERYEFDLNIDANKSVIQRLEPIAKRIANMTPEEQRVFKLPDGLGDGMSNTIYKRVIKKIYDQERGKEVLECLHEHPSVAVPIILKRLKQKDEEWRRSQREWNKVWREIEGKNFYKSLDHQGITFKNLDKRILSSKSFIAEIEAVYREQYHQPKEQLPGFHLKFEFEEKQIQSDIQRLVMSYLEKGNQFSREELDRVLRFLKKIIGSLHPTNEALPGQVFFGNNSFYLFFRLWQIAYQRLSKLCQNAQKIGHVNNTGYSRQSKQQQNNSVAQSLDLIPKREVLVEVENGDLYKAMLTLIEKLFEGEIDLSGFEEQSRFWFGTEAFIIYTVDKLFHHLCKQLIQIVTDPPCIKLFSLFLKQEQLPQPSNESENQTQQYKEMYYRQKADEIVEEDENFYKFILSKECLKIELLGDLGDGTPNAAVSAEKQWSEYIDQYVKLTTTQPNIEPRIPVYLNRILKRTKEAEMKPFYALNQLECKICVNTFKMFFVEHSEDVFVRPFTQQPIDQELLNEKAHKFTQWADNQLSNESSTDISSFFETGRIQNTEEMNTDNEQQEIELRPFKTEKVKEESRFGTELIHYKTEYD